MKKSLQPATKKRKVAHGVSTKLVKLKPQQRIENFPDELVTCKILARGVKEDTTLGWWWGLLVHSYFVAPSPTELIHFSMSGQRGNGHVVDAVA